MRCKDCLSFEVCDIAKLLEDSNPAKMEDIKCIHRKDKSKYIEVVRCKDCEFCKSWQQTEDLYCSIHSTTLVTIQTSQDNFCRHGKRKG